MDMKYFFFALVICLPALSQAAPSLQSEHRLGELFQPEKGKELFQNNGCTMCHGEDGSGKGPMATSLKNQPRNFRDYEEMRRMPDIRMEQAISKGLEGTAMPAFPGFSQEELEALTTYLHSILSDSHTTVDMCLYETAILDTDKAPENFRVEVDEPERVEALAEGKKIHITIKNWGKFLGKKSWRTHVRIMQGNRIFSLVRVKVRPCLNNLEKLVKSLAAASP